MNWAYYNDNDPFCAQWLRNLTTSGAPLDYPPALVDQRSVKDVPADAVYGLTQAHFFAGIGGWAYALKLAGWPANAPVWTGSCPCQPFSTAGRGKGFDDERHLWPAWFSLIEACRPVVIFGEQVGGAAGRAWLDLVCTDLENGGYSTWAASLPAAGVGAPHVRQRLFFVAYTTGQRFEKLRLQLLEGRQNQARLEASGRSPDGALGLGNAGSAGSAGSGRDTRAVPGPQGEGGGSGGIPGDRSDLPLHASSASGPWSDVEWAPCRDGKGRPLKSGIEPLAHGVPARMGKLRAYGNAIVPQVAAQFIKAFIDTVA